MTDIYAGQDPRDLPRYTFAEAARILAMPAATVRAWTKGRTLAGRSDLVPVVQPAAPHALSFTNLVELHVLRAMRRVHGVSMSNVRDALDTLRKKMPGPHPLANHTFHTDGIDLFTRALGRLVKLSRSEQLSMHEQLKLHLDRVERDEAGLARRLYPYMGGARNVIIDPRVSFGRPVIEGTGVPIDNLVERFDAGESVDDLALDYGIDREAVERAIVAAQSDAA